MGGAPAPRSCRAGMLHFHGDMGQVGQPGEPLPVMRRLASLGGCDRNDGTEMSRAQPPEMQVGYLVALAFDDAADLVRHTRVWRSIEQDASGIAQQSDRPVRDHKRSNQSGQRVHPEPAERTRQQEPNDDQNGHEGVSQDMDHGGPHIVVAVMRAVRGFVAVLHEFQLVVVLLAPLHKACPGEEGMRFGNLVARLQIFAAILERKQLAATVRPDGFDGETGSLQRRAIVRPDAEARRHIVFKDLDFQYGTAEFDATGFLVVAMSMSVTDRVHESGRGHDRDDGRLTTATRSRR